MAKIPRPESHLPWLDGLRGAAALAVVFHHLYAIALHYYPSDSVLMKTAAMEVFMALGRWGVLGVPCFFVLSGFCIGQTWLRADSPVKFAWRRWRRIFPPYYASLVVVLLCVVTVRALVGVNDITALPAPTLKNILATATLMTAPASETPEINWVYWTLSYEVVFYASLSAVLCVRPSIRFAALICFHALVCGVAIFSRRPLAPGMWFFCELWPLFGLGLTVALAPRSRLSALSIGFLSLAALVPLQMGGRHPGFAITGLVIMGLVAASAQGYALPRWRPLEKVGQFSYSLYLIHVPLLLAVGKYFVLRPGQTAALFLLGITVTVALLIGSAYAFYVWCERPFLTSARASPAIAP